MITHKELFTAKTSDDLVDRILADKKKIKTELKNCFDGKGAEVCQYFAKIDGNPINIMLGCLP
ncbi:MAG: hypothetical protein AABX75_02060 [Nanoarchaeota archaeon]